MIGAREGPQIAVHAVEKFDFDGFLFCGNEIAKGHFEILRAKRSGIREQLISRTGGEHNEVGGVFPASGRERYAFRTGFDASDARMDRYATGGRGAVEEESIQYGAGVNHDRARHLETRAMASAGNQFRGADFFFDLRAAQQEGIFFDGFVGEAAAAGFFPCEMLVKQRDVEARAGEFFSAEGAGRPSANYGNLFHSDATSIVEGHRSGPERKYSINGRGFGVARLGRVTEIGQILWRIQLYVK